MFYTSLEVFIHVLTLHIRVSLSFLPKGEQAHICVQSMWQSTKNVLILDLLLDTIWWNVGLFLHKHFTLYCVIKGFILLIYI